MQKLRQVVSGTVLAGFFVCAGAWPQLSHAVGTVASSETKAAAAEYVSRTREVSSSDFSIDAMPDRDSMLVYRVTLRPGLDGGLEAERMFEVYVDKRSGLALGEGNVGGN